MHARACKRDLTDTQRHPNGDSRSSAESGTSHALRRPRAPRKPPRTGPIRSVRARSIYSHASPSSGTARSTGVRGSVSDASNWMRHKMSFKDHKVTKPRIAQPCARCESDQQAVGFGISSNEEAAARAGQMGGVVVASGSSPANPARGAVHAPRRVVLDLDALLGSHAHGLQLHRGRGGAGAVRKRGSWHLAVGGQAGAGGTVFSPAALKVVDVVQTLSAGGSESRPPRG